MATLTLHLSESMQHELDLFGQEFLLELLERGLREFKVDRALTNYKLGHMTFGAAAKMAELPESELVRYAYIRGIEPPYSEQTLNEELG